MSWCPGLPLVDEPHVTDEMVELALPILVELFEWKGKAPATAFPAEARDFLGGALRGPALRNRSEYGDALNCLRELAKALSAMAERLAALETIEPLLDRAARYPHLSDGEFVVRDVAIAIGPLAALKACQTLVADDCERLDVNLESERERFLADDRGPRVLTALAFANALASRYRIETGRLPKASYGRVLSQFEFSFFR